MDELLKCILDGSLALDVAVRWALAESDEEPALVTRRPDLNAPPSNSWLGLPVPSIPSNFRRYILHVVKEEALNLLRAAGSFPPFNSWIIAQHPIPGMR